MQIEKKKAFDDVIIETVDIVLIDIFGGAGANIIKQQLKARYLLDFNVNPLNKQRFNIGIIDLLGSGGDMVLRTIIQYMSEDLGLDLGIREQDFIEQLIYLEREYNAS